MNWDNRNRLIYNLRYYKFTYKIVVLSVLFIIIGSTINAQHRPQGGRKPSGSITGQVFDSVLNQPIEYATIILFSKRDSVQITGTSTNETGLFELTELRLGRYYLQISFLGYELKKINENSP